MLALVTFPHSNFQCNFFYLFFFYFFIFFCLIPHRRFKKSGYVSSIYWCGCNSNFHLIISIRFVFSVLYLNYFFFFVPLILVYVNQNIKLSWIIIRSINTIHKNLFCYLIPNCEEKKFNLNTALESTILHWFSFYFVILICVSHSDWIEIKGDRLVFYTGIHHSDTKFFLYFFNSNANIIFQFSLHSI